MPCFLCTVLPLADYDNGVYPYESIDDDNDGGDDEDADNDYYDYID